MVTAKTAKTFQAFYTKSTPIVEYMVNCLLLNPTDKIFEPCGGDGDLVEAILKRNKDADIEVCELNQTAVETLQKKFSKFPKVKVVCTDTLLDTELSFKSNLGGFYDKIIANPPYGAWQDHDKRAILKKLYPLVYAKETYTLFLFRCLELLKEGGILTFIIPDTWLNLHLHKNLRKHILTKAKIREIALFPSSFFPNVNFGYANLSIITLQKCSNENECLENEFKVLQQFSAVEDLPANQAKSSIFKQKEILSFPDYSFILTDDNKLTKLICESGLKIGDIANCVTGFYSGNDKEFLQVANSQLKNGKNYALVKAEQISTNYLQHENLLTGIKNEQCFVPIVKGGNTKYLKPDNWFMDWSEKAVVHYKTDKKARFQNPQFYFKHGIGIPMVSSSSITACLIENKLFDQSIVGVFPHNETLTLYLLGFFNSPTCNKLIRAINSSTNNSANYIKKIPYILADNGKRKRITENVSEILESIKSETDYSIILETEINELFKQIYGF
jgi:tRNA1(Val) A37 N6-methylase TrmN6